MLALTPSERRGALVLVLLLLIGAGHDLWRARAPARGRVSAARPDPVAPDSIPAAVPGPASGITDTLPPAVGPGRAPLDLNRAGVRELDALPGVGPVIAGRIVQQRARFGPFEGLDDLLAVRGVGPRLVARLRPWTTVRPPGRLPRAAPSARSDSSAKSPR